MRCFPRPVPANALPARYVYPSGHEPDLSTNAPSLGKRKGMVENDLRLSSCGKKIIDWDRRMAIRRLLRGNLPLKARGD